MTDPEAPAEPITLTHIAGLNVSIKDRFVRQRCAWCDVILVEYDLAGMGPVVYGPQGQVISTQAAVFPIGALVREQQQRFDVITGPLPDDFCGWMDTATPD